MVSLFIDTTSNDLIIGLLKDDKLLDEEKLLSIKTHNIFTLELIDKLLIKNSLNINDVKKMYVASGPGSFTGTRIGISIAKTICYSLNIPIISISSLNLGIFNYENYDYYINIIADNKNNSYIGIYDKNYDKISEELINNDKIENKINKLSNYIVVDNKEYNIEKIVNYYINKSENVHDVKPNYIKEVI